MARKTTTTKGKTATAKTDVDLQKLIVTMLGERGVKAKVMPSPSRRYVSILVDGTNVGYVFTQTRAGVRVLPALSPDELPKAVKGFKPSKRLGAFGVIGGFHEKNLSHAVDALALAAKLQDEHRTT
jgi:hypothetical protein